MDDGGKVAFVLILFLGLAAVAIAASKRPVVENQPAYSRANNYPASGPSGHGYAEPVRAESAILYENEERIQFVRGPDRLLEEIIWHRKVTQDVG